MFKFEILEIWKEGVDFCNRCYDLSFSFLKHEQFALSDQLRRAAISITNNIVEGSGSGTQKSFKRYINISIGSLYEVVNIIIFAKKESILTRSKEKRFIVKLNT